MRESYKPGMILRPVRDIEIRTKLSSLTISLEQLDVKVYS